MACNFKSQSTDHKKTKKSRTRYRSYLNPIKKKDYKAHQRNLGLRLTIEEILKILAHISFQTNKGFLL